MNAIRATQALNKRELENATPVTASWHTDYRDTAYIYIGGLDNRLTEGDVAVIFSQYGNPTHLQLMRDKETGKSKGFAFLKYEDQRSCDLAVDNLGGAEVLGRMLRVDHTRYKARDDEDANTWRLERLEALQDGGDGRESGDETEESDEGEKRRKRRRPLLKEERELQEMLAVTQDEGEDEDPMRDYLIKEKREEVERAKERAERKEKSKHRHHHHHHHRGRDNEGDKKEPERSSDRHSHRHRDGERDRRRHDGDDDDEERRTKR